MSIRANILAVVMTGVTSVPLMFSAHADELPTGFIALHGTHTDAHGKVVPALRTASAAFLPLTARNFKGLRVAPRQVAPEDQEPVAAAEVLSHKPEHSIVSDEQAQQIIYLYGEGN